MLLIAVVPVDSIASGCGSCFSRDGFRAYRIRPGSFGHPNMSSFPVSTRTLLCGRKGRVQYSSAHNLRMVTMLLAWWACSIIFADLFVMLRVFGVLKVRGRNKQAAGTVSFMSLPVGLWQFVLIRMQVQQRVSRNRHVFSAAVRRRGCQRLSPHHRTRGSLNFHTSRRVNGRTFQRACGSWVDPGARRAFPPRTRASQHPRY